MEEEYYKELAYIQAQKDIEQWEQWEEHCKQKPAKVVLLTETHAIDTKQVCTDS